MQNRTLILLLICLPWAASLAAGSGAELSSSLFKLDLMQAKDGNAEAQHSLAARYEEGHGVEADLAQAVAWYRRAADQGHAPAHFKLGQLYEEGRGVPQDSRQALIWYTSAAEMGDRNARERLKAIVAKRQAEARKAALAKQRAEEQARAQAAAKQRAAAPTPPPAPVPAKPSAKPARATPPAAPSFPNLRQTILESKWDNGGQAAHRLPSALTSCLATGQDEVVCFSREATRKLGGAELRYTVKATLRGFRDDGRFDLSYLFNVTGIKGPADAARDADGLQAKEGWQPALQLRCQAESRRSIRCQGREGGSVRFVAAR